MNSDFQPPNDDETHGGGSDVATTPTARVIEAFGGIRPMAHKLGIPVTTVQGWKRRNHIPENRHQEIEVAAETHGLALAPGLLEAAGQVPGPDGLTAVTSGTPADGAPAAVAIESMPDRILASAETVASGGSMPSGVWTATAIAVAAAVASITAPFWSPGLFGPETTEIATPPAEIVGLSDRVEFLENRVAELPATPIASTATVTELADRIAALEERPAPGSDIGRFESAESELARLSARIDRSEERLAAAEGRLAAGVDPATVNAALADLRSSLTGRLDAVERAVIEARTRDAAAQALAVAAGTLRAAVLDGRPWATDLQTVRALAAGDQTIAGLVEMLAQRAEAGVATSERLRSSFGAAAGQARLAARVPEDAGVIDRALDAVTGLVTVRPAPGEVEGDAPEQVLARAEGRLIDGDISGTLEALSTLSGAAAEAMAPWVAEAKARLDATAAADSLVSATLARLGGAQGEPGSP